MCPRSSFLLLVSLETVVVHETMVFSGRDKVPRPVVQGLLAGLPFSLLGPAQTLAPGTRPADPRRPLGPPFPVRLRPGRPT